jgi:predicted DNA-binding transcriptional regulator AlpA
MKHSTPSLDTGTAETDSPGMGAEAGTTTEGCTRTSPPRLLTIEEVCWRLSRSSRTIERYLQDPQLEFPRPVRLGPRDRAWIDTEIEDWIRQRPRL